MRRALRPLAVFGIATGVSLTAALQLLVGGAQGSDAPPATRSAGFRSSYDLAKLSLLGSTLFYIEEQYVEPGRIDWERMFVASLESVEGLVPGCMFTREPGGDVLSVEVGEYRTVLEVAPVESMERLETELSRIAELLTRHLDPEDIGTEHHEDPFAAIEYAMINGLLSTLDPHSVLMPPEDSREMDLENRGAFGGLGITIVEGDGGLVIEYPMPGTPAERSGLLPDDRIVRIDGESTINMSLEDAVDRLRGEIGEPVTLQIVRDSFDVPRDFDIVRDRIRIKPVEGELLDGGIGYVQIQSFHQEVEGDLNALLALLSREAGGSLRGLVLDLRGNPGGYLNQAVAVADRFLRSGTIVSTVDGAGRRLDLEEASQHNAEPEYPIAVLVNASSASASEIVAGALRNNDRAVIVGERTFGKGSVQNLHPFFDHSKLKLTVSKYLTPGDKSIQSVGIPADISLVPSIVEARDDDAGGDVASLYSRGMVRREADLDKHLDRMDFRTDEPAYTVHYWRGAKRRRRSPDLDLADDYQVQFARDVLLAAPSARRADVLVAASRVVQQHRAVENAKIVQHFSDIGLDWRDGPAVPRGGDLPLQVEISVGPDGRLVAGDEGAITVTVTNTSTSPLYRVALVAEEGLIDGREFLFGRMGPGESGSWTHRVTPVTGTPAERAPLRLEVHDSGPDALGSVDMAVEVAPRPLPNLAWMWEISDDGVGDGDGIAEVGEQVQVVLTVENQGDGPTVEPFARLKNHSGKALDIIEGNIGFGTMLAADGTPCSVDLPGVEAGAVVGDPSADPARVERRDPPVYGRGCKRVLAAGDRWTGAFTVALREPPADGEWELELRLGDNNAYDHGSVVEAGFYSYFDQSARIAVPLGTPSVASEWHRPPTIQISRGPDTVSKGARATLSGVVLDDVGVAHVMVFAGDDKVFYQGGGPTSRLRAVPFTADVSLAAGRNVLTVLAKDVDGHTRSASLVTWYGRDEAVAHAETP
ncbi:MAG: carboxyl-terminal processing protease [Myxococcota bacterium]|jgi:carboxyl-terminal processing protease